MDRSPWLKAYDLKELVRHVATTIKYVDNSKLYTSHHNTIKAFVIAGSFRALHGFVTTLRKVCTPSGSTRTRPSPSSNPSFTYRARSCRCWFSTQQMVSAYTGCLKFSPILFLPRIESQEFCFLDHTVQNGTNLQASTSLDQDRRPSRDCYTVAHDRPRPGRASGINLIFSRVLGKGCQIQRRWTVCLSDVKYER